MQGNRVIHMNIIIFGAGAIGSLLGGLLSKNNNVLLIGRENHVSTIKKSGLIIEGKTHINVKINAETHIDDVKFFPDLLILTVKSYDTEPSILQVKKIINRNTTVLSLQNGLDNIDKINKYLPPKQVIAGVTTHGAFFSKPGIIKHTGLGSTVLGELSRNKTERIEGIVFLFNHAGIRTTVSQNIVREIWIKAIINSSINPLTTIFRCKNGYLLKNPIFEKLLEKICKESTSIANADGLNLTYENMIKKTKNIIKNTAENYSSMLQSFKKGQRTEIDAINGRLAVVGKKHNVDTSLNDMLIYSVKSLV